jgi:hypothetical protein
LELSSGPDVASGTSPPVTETRTMRGVLLWLIGIPIPIIILLYLFHVI